MQIGRKKIIINIFFVQVKMHFLLNKAHDSLHIFIIPDDRQPWKITHKLSDIFLLTICAVILCAEVWRNIQDFGETHLDFLK